MKISHSRLYACARGVACAASLLVGCEDEDLLPVGGRDADAENALTFFVSSDTSTTGDLGGLLAADARCQRLAAAVSADGHTFHAYLSVENGPADESDGGAGGPVNARDRIGQGPWHNAKGALVAKDLEALHARTGDSEIFLDEHGEKINGQWPGSPTPNEHDILTGSDGQGRLIAEQTCRDWTSTSADDIAAVGHSDGLGPNQNGAAPYSSWNSAHTNAGCNDTAPRGGAGRIYCFAVD